MWCDTQRWVILRPEARHHPSASFVLSPPLSGTSTQLQASIFIPLPQLPLLSPTYLDPPVIFPACCLTLVPSPWPQPGPWSTCLRAPPPAPHYHMNTGREGPAEAWTPTEGNGFAIHSSSTSSHSLYTVTGPATTMIEDRKRDRCAFTRSCQACAHSCVHACVSVCVNGLVIEERWFFRLLHLVRKK